MLNQAIVPNAPEAHKVRHEVKKRGVRPTLVDSIEAIIREMFSEEPLYTHKQLTMKVIAHCKSHNLPYAAVSVATVRRARERCWPR